MTINETGPLPGTFASASMASGQLDQAKYMPMLDDFEISDTQKRELLETLWSIMCAMVEIGFTVDICAQIFPACQTGSDTARDDVKLEQTNDGEVIELDQEDESA